MNILIRVTLKLTILIFLGLLFSSSTLYSTEIYKWIDDEGNVYFGEDPPENSSLEKISLEPISSSDPFTTKPDTIDKRIDDPSENLESNQYSRTLKSKARLNNRICLLRYGLKCNKLFHWKSIIKKKLNTRDSCSKIRHVLVGRPSSLSSRDIDLEFPTIETTSKEDGKCLTKSGFYCFELQDDSWCKENFFQPCNKLENWVSQAVDKCGLLREECSLKKIVIEYRPRSNEEIRYRRQQGDLLGNALNLPKNTCNNIEIIRSALDRLPGD